LCRKRSGGMEVVMKIVLYVFAFLELFMGIGAGSAIVNAGTEMEWIRSQAGNSVAEAFYNYMGSAVMGLGAFVFVLTVYIFFRMIVMARDE
jgi:hypothetical protein